MLVFLINFPTGVTLGSPGVRPLALLLGRRLHLHGAELIHLKRLVVKATRSWLKITGPLEVSFTAAAVPSIIGENSTIATSAPNMSMMRFIVAFGQAGQGNVPDMNHRKPLTNPPYRGAWGSCYW